MACINCCAVTAGYVWAYNTQIYYQDVGTDDRTIAWYMSWIPLVFGCLGVTLGGFISDRIVTRLGPYARLGVLIVSQVSLTSVLLGHVESGHVICCLPVESYQHCICSLFYLFHFFLFNYSCC